jgi:hypothetical protein
MVAIVHVPVAGITIAVEIRRSEDGSTFTGHVMPSAALQTALGAGLITDEDLDLAERTAVERYQLARVERFKEIG